MTTQKIEDAAKTLLDVSGGSVDDAIAALRLLEQSTNKKTRKNDGDMLIDLQNVAKHYKVGSQKVEALKGVSLRIKQGEFVALTGASGSGKSTLLQLIGGLDKPHAGTIIIDGNDIAKLSDRKLSKFRNKTVGFVFQFFYLQPFLNVKTNVEVPAMFARRKPKSRHEQSVAMIESVDLGDRANHLPRELSGGQMQRAAIARALMNKPKLLLADEPTGNLDSTNAAAIFKLFEKLRTEFGMTVVVVTHDHLLASQADRVIKLSDGVIV